MIHDSVLGAVGGTPLIRLSRLHPPGNLVAKLESTNPGGNVKERIAIAMVDRAEELGLLGPGGTIVEPTSGNTGVGLAMVGCVRGYRVICTVPDKVSVEKIALLRAYGAEVIVTPTDRLPEDEDSYYGVARRLAVEIPGAHMPNQYANPANPDAHHDTTGPELWEQTAGAIGAFIAGAGTGGTITGVGRYLKERNPDVLVVGADPEGSIYSAASDAEVHQYLVEGVGEDFWPETIDPSVVDEFQQVGDADSFATARRLARTEGILTGGSGGMAVHAAVDVATRHPDRLVVVLIPDSGRGYLSKVFDDTWMADHGFEVAT
jgi:cystathionine beta-synthase